MRTSTKKAGAASGQKVPNNGDPAKSNDFVGRGGATERADFGGNAAIGAKAEFATTKFRQKSEQKRVAESKLRMEKQADKVEKAKERLANQKPPKKPGPVKKAGRAVGNSVHGYVHGKIYEVEHENVGTEGAHQTEIVGEAVLRHGTWFAQKQIREHPQKAVHKLKASTSRQPLTISTGPPCRNTRK